MKRSLLLSLIVYGFCTLAFIWGILLTTIYGWRCYVVLQMEKNIAEVARRGEPTTLMEYQAYYKITDESLERGRLYFDDEEELKFAPFPTVQDINNWKPPEYPPEIKNLPYLIGGGKAPKNGSRLDPKIIPQAVSYLKTQTESLSFLREGRDHPEKNYGFIFVDPYRTGKRNSQLRNHMKLLQLGLATSLASGNKAEAYEYLLDLFNITNGFNEEHSIIGRLLQVGVQANALNALAYTMSLERLSDTEINHLLGLLSLPDEKQMLNDARITEQTHICMSRGVIPVAPEMKQYLRTLPLRNRVALWLNKFLEMERYAILTYLQAYNRYYDRSALSYAERKMLIGTLPKDDPESTQYAAYLRANDGFHKRMVQAITRIQCARVALLIEKFRNETGQYPKSLEEIIPRFLTEIPVDSFEGLPLIYERLENGISVVPAEAIRQENDESVHYAGATPKEVLGFTTAADLTPGHPIERVRQSRQNLRR